MKIKKNARRKKKILNQHYKNLIKQAWDNEHILHQFQSMELRLMQCGSLPELIQVLFDDSKKQFDLDIVTLNLLDPDAEIQRLLQQSEINTKLMFPNLTFSSDKETLVSLFDANLLPKLCPYNVSLHEALFQHCSEPIESVALILLKRGDHIMGSLNFGDSKPDRFRSNAATDFLQHLSAVISVCFNMAILHDGLKNIGLRDALTGINNRRFFDQRLPEEISRSQRTNKHLSCLFINVDHFKKFNHSYGHVGGDLILKQVASMIREELRTTDVVGRYGGEEFAALLTETEAIKALLVAERIRKRIQRHRLTFAGHLVQVTVSIGVACIQSQKENGAKTAETGELLITAADNALYKAKQAGRNRVVSAEWS